MRQDKERIFQLRREGRTYREIQRDTGVSRATLSLWFKDQGWSRHLSLEHSKKNLGASKDRMERINMVRKLKLQYQYALVEKEAESEYEIYKKESLFWAGLMLYAGEGDKKTRHQIRISNSEPYIHKIFTKFAIKYIDFSSEEFRYSLVIYPDNNSVEIVSWWAKELDVSENQFYKTTTILGRDNLKRLQYGTCVSIISSTAKKKKLMKWLALAEIEKF